MHFQAVCRNLYTLSSNTYLSIFEVAAFHRKEIFNTPPAWCGALHCMVNTKINAVPVNFDEPVERHCEMDIEKLYFIAACIKTTKTLPGDFSGDNHMERLL